MLCRSPAWSGWRRIRRLEAALWSALALAEPEGLWEEVCETCGPTGSICEFRRLSLRRRSLPVEKSIEDLWKRGLQALGLALPPGGADRLWAYAEELLKWNAKVNLTAITRPEEVLEKHLLDSLAALPEVGGATRLLDLGAGAGLPGIPLAVALPHLDVTLVDAVLKKVAFIKVGAVRAQVTGQIRAVHARLGGVPEAEGLERMPLVISRAFMELGAFLALARPYVESGGRIIAMLGQAPSDDALAELAQAAGVTFAQVRRFELPFSRAARAVAVFHVEHHAV